MKKKEPPGRTLRRVCQEYASRAAAHLRDANVPEAVHNARREIKRMRALFRLRRGAAGGKDTRRTAAVMRLAAKPLAALRDAQATGRAFAALAAGRGRQFPELRLRLEAYARRAEHDFKKFGSDAVAKYLLRRVRGRLESLDWKALGWPEMRRGVERSYARGREACQRARRQPSPENFHRWRKRTKELWFQLAFLSSDWPPATKALLGGLAKLGNELGDEHDLLLLEEFTREQGLPGGEAGEVQKLIDARRKQIGTSIRRLGLRLYTDRPEVMGAQVEQDWQAWRKASRR